MTEPIKVTGPLKVKSTSEVKSVAGAIAELVRAHEPVEIQVIGAGAVNQATKALIVARGFVSTDGVDLSYVPAFVELDIDGEKRTGVKFIVKY